MFDFDAFDTYFNNHPVDADEGFWAARALTVMSSIVINGSQNDAYTKDIIIQLLTEVMAFAPGSVYKIAEGFMNIIMDKMDEGGEAPTLPPLFNKE